MPKKMGENTKAVQARERKKLAKQAADEKAAKDAEDKLWMDNDKLLAKKKSRKEEEEKKKAEQARKKAEAKLLLEQEMASIKTEAKQSTVQKITRHQIENSLEQRKNVEPQKIVKTASSKVVEQNLMEENLNRAMENTIIATNVDEAIAALRIENETDRHPEKRMKAEFKAFEAENLPRIKQENPTLRLSQWNQILIKEWNKSPRNPMNQTNS